MIAFNHSIPKPLFSLTPTKAKYVNHNTHPVPLEVKDLDKLLAEEKTKNRRLIDELNRLKREGVSLYSMTDIMRKHF